MDLIVKVFAFTIIFLSIFAGVLWMVSKSYPQKMWSYPQSKTFPFLPVKKLVEITTVFQSKHFYKSLNPYSTKAFADFNAKYENSCLWE